MTYQPLRTRSATHRAVPAVHRPTACITMDAFPNLQTLRLFKEVKAMDMTDEWLDALSKWATSNHNVWALWIFGSRAKGTSQPDSDIDIAIELVPPTNNHNRALWAYIELFDEWKDQLRQAVSWSVSLVAIGPGFDMDKEVRETGVLIWKRN
jgi:predicted nucleotidyltransferase